MAAGRHTGPAGPQGPAGPTGNTGPTGPPGQPVEIIQPVMDTEWVLVHNLGRRPAGVTVYDTSDTEYEGNTEVVDLNTLKITFSVPISGRAVLV